MISWKILFSVIQKNFRAYNGKRKYQMMKNGYLRLQAVIRSRILSHRFRHLRGHIIRLQARSRGYLVRREFARKKWAVITIQSHVRRMIAQREYRKMRIERRALQEALRLKEEEARAMEKKYGKKRAREEAERKFQQRIELCRCWKLQLQA